MNNLPGRARQSRLEIDSAAIAHNIDVIKACLRPGVRFLAVVKADSYGHGAAGVLRLALEKGAFGGAVAIPEEGMALREQGFTCPLLILGGVDEYCADAAVEYDLAQAAPDLDALRVLGEAAARCGKRAIIHIKLDTGMARIGARTASEVEAMLDYIAANRALFEVQGVFSHFARADESTPEAREFTHMQAWRFDKLCGLITARGFAPLRHIANSAAIDMYPQYQCDVVRPGVSLYGYGAFGGDYRYAQRWVARASFCKTLPAGSPVGYGGAFVTARETRVLTVPVGYADGYSRAFGGRACALVRGRRAPVIGRVCMDQLMLDVTDIPQASAGDECVLLGAQGAERITPVELADIAGTIPYEIMLAPSYRVPRVWL